MAKLTLDDLRKLRDAKRAEIRQRETSDKPVLVIVGMGTCGIAAGAKETFDAFVDALAKNKINNVRVQQTGCMGLCHSEPTVEVQMPGMPTVIYGLVGPDVARKIVDNHLLHQTLVNEHVFDKPAADIMREG